VLLLALPAFAFDTLDRPLDAPVPYAVDSGWLNNGSDSPQVLHDEVVQIAGASWLRLYFGDVELGEGSYLRITSDLDGEVQELDAAALDLWSQSTAYFNGDTLHVEVVGGPQSQANRLIIDQVAWEIYDPSKIVECGICADDDRVPSYEDFAARLLPAGCSSTVYNSQSCMVSAGHCISGGMVLQFQVPLSSPNCSLNHPPVSEQFPAEQYLFTNGGVGNDWSVIRAGANNLGEKPYERYGLSKPIATTPPSTGQSVTVWGYGIDEPCIYNQVQQTSSGTLQSVSSTYFTHWADTTYGNSGSSMIRNGTEIIGIATHCPCPNVATRIDHPSFVAARESLCPSVVPEVATLISATVTSGTHVTGGLAALRNSDGQHFVVDSAAQGVRQNAITVLEAQSPDTSIAELSVRIEYGPADATPVYHIAQIFNHDTGAWKLLPFGIVSETSDTIVQVDDIANPNAYVDGTGRIRVRLIQTARLVQIPDGYTKLVDQVEVVVLP
jgi:hypothetical protein